ncbi:restriction endonuclease subunit S [Acetobacter senegalensis]|uniref:restriction endonuclease subunit S n=1 Tax=Acetobacter senegalensis TaxID=446692 RepID=UPI001EDB64ED|nr:restriction endonuclease subunit S [Acetobacter senegalensis]MCG4258865.1 restriction endonuclease subunit S [Acetobacter senegalensis]
MDDFKVKLMEKWKICTIGDQITLQRGVDITQKNSQAGKIPVISSGGLSFFHDTAVDDGPGVIIGRKGSLGTVYWSAGPYWPHDTTLWVKDFKGNNRRFIYYFMKTLKTKNLDVGSSNPTLNRNHVHPISVIWPPLKEQESISKTLSVLDDKIDLNRRTNETLEAMARALFRDWFVDFGPTRAKMAGEAPYLAPKLWELFPDKLDEEGKPEGWQTESLDETATFLNGLALQKYPATGDTSLPAIKIAQLRSESTDTADPVSPDIPDNYIVEQNDLLFSWSGSLLCKFWNGQRGALNQHLFKVTSKRFEPWFIYEWIQFYMPEFQAIATAKATTMGHIQRRHLTESLVTIPPANIMQAANKAIGSLIVQIQSNNGQSRTLAQLRDLLLPKLMSGEISIRDAEKMVEDAA